MLEACIQGLSESRHLRGRIRVLLHILLQLVEETRRTRKPSDPADCGMYAKIGRIRQRQAAILRRELHFVGKVVSIERTNINNPIAMRGALANHEK